MKKMYLHEVFSRMSIEDIDKYEEKRSEMIKKIHKESGGEEVEIVDDYGVLDDDGNIRIVMDVMGKNRITKYVIDRIKTKVG